MIRKASYNRDADRWLPLESYRLGRKHDGERRLESDYWLPEVEYLDVFVSAARRVSSCPNFLITD